MASKTQARHPPPSNNDGQRTIIGAQWQGPLPPPGALEQFDHIIPNGAERIMRMCELEQSARIERERSTTKAEITIEVGGRILGALLLLVCVGAAIWSVVQGAPALVTLGFLGVPLLGTIAKLFDRKK